MRPAAAPLECMHTDCTIAAFLQEYVMTTSPTTTLILAIVLIVLAIGTVAWVVMQRQKSANLKRRFGPEYDRAIKEYGGRTKAEAELNKRQQRVAGLNIIPITAADAARFSNAWSSLQGRFVDDPQGVVAEADLLVRELMIKRGYPMGDFELRAADISVDHPSVVKNYRAAQIIALRNARREADTEELRTAVVHYRTLFDELLGAVPAKVAAVAAAPAVRGVPVRS
jgi:hypothetical protein